MIIHLIVEHDRNRLNNRTLPNKLRLYTTNGVYIVSWSSAPEYPTVKLTLNSVAIIGNNVLFDGKEPDELIPSLKDNILYAELIGDDTQNLIVSKIMFCDKPFETPICKYYVQGHVNIPEAKNPLAVCIKKHENGAKITPADINKALQCFNPDTDINIITAGSELIFADNAEFNSELSIPEKLVKALRELVTKPDTKDTIKMTVIYNKINDIPIRHILQFPIRLVHRSGSQIEVKTFITSYADGFHVNTPELNNKNIKIRYISYTKTNSGRNNITVTSQILPETEILDFINNCTNNQFNLTLNTDSDMIYTSMDQLQN